MRAFRPPFHTIHENLGRLLPAIFRDLRQTPLSTLAAWSNRSFPFCARRVKAPWQAARCAYRLARCVCRSSFPKISLRCDFREPSVFLKGSRFINAAQIHLSCKSLTANWGRWRKSVVLLARVLFSVSSIYHSAFGGGPFRARKKIIPKTEKSFSKRLTKYIVRYILLLNI